MTEQSMQTPSQELLNKYETLKEYLRSLGSAAIAFSGGVDSAFLLYAAKEALQEKVLAITLTASCFPKREEQEAKELCNRIGVRHLCCEMDVMQIEGFADNPANRCYICKTALFGKLRELTGEYGLQQLIEGSNVDDEGDYRPGLIAIRELNVKSPLRECRFTKAEIRILSRYFDLPTWKKPSYACLASRFPYGEEITPEKLRMVEQGEDLLLAMGFTQFRVRIHGTVARIEILPEEFEKAMLLENRQQIATAFREYGFAYTALDLEGYRTGSMNETLAAAGKEAL